MPPSQIPWLIEQPDSVLSAKSAQFDQMEATTTLMCPALMTNPIHEGIIRRELKGQLNALTADMMDEVGYAMDDIWGLKNDDWKPVNLDQTLKTIVARASNRVLVGLPLCEYCVCLSE